MKSFLVFITVLCLLSCSRSKSKDPDCPPFLYNYWVLSQRTIDTATTDNIFIYSINPGNKLVFLYQYINDPCGMAYDAGYRESVVFEVPADANSFSFGNKELKNANAYHRIECFCPNTNARPVTEGSLTGYKLSNATWHVQGTITIPGSSNVISINKSFTEK